MLKDTFLRTLARKPGPPRKLADGAGLYLAVRPSGALLWRFNYRGTNGRQQTASFGAYPEVGLSKARDLHRDFKLALAAGVTPAAERRAAEHEAATTQPFRVVANQWLDIAVPQDVRASKTRQRAERSVAALNAVAGNIEISAVRILDIVPALQRLEREGKFETRSRVQAHAKDIMNFAVSRGLIEMSPLAALRSKGFTPPTEKPRDAITDPAQFGQLLRKIDFYETRQSLARYALNLLALTFVRPGDVQRARWADFDLDAGFWIIPFVELKMRTQRKAAGMDAEPHLVPLSRQAITLLRELQAITGLGEFLFPGRQRARTMSANTLNTALKSMGYDGIHNAHGFRSTASTLLNRERVDGRRRFEQALIEIQLNHLDRSTRAIYDRDDMRPERVVLMQFWADRIDEYRDGAKVVPLRPKKRA